ncbi:hypothetical protein [Actinophytocola sp. NPDC049390]|uniref:hypothetical protein n=1 Tax=Actinophytocola sp. NPDC049390 TaxID=3363894 RepID=UPI0037AFC503
MSDDGWVALFCRFTPGWPWPEESYGLDPMYGPDGWCRSCGTPLRPQSGPLTIQGSKFPSASVWMPNWRFDVVCLAADVAREISGRFAVKLREVHKPRSGGTGVMQLIPSVTDEAWYDPAQLSVAVTARHEELNGESTGAHCPGCGRWKWLPILEGEAPIRAEALATTSAVIASPEVFGDGLQSFRHLLFRQPLAAALVRANPRTWSELPVAATTEK